MKHAFQIKLNKGKVNELLSISERVEGKDILYSAINIASLDHSQEFEVEFKVNNSEGGPFADIVLFENGVEINCTEPLYEIPTSPVRLYDGGVEFEIHLN